MKSPTSKQVMAAADAPSMKNVYDSSYVDTARMIEAKKMHAHFNKALRNPDAVVPKERSAFIKPATTTTALPPANTSVRSTLADVDIPAEHFTHNNMVPFFGGSIKQNTEGLEKLGGRFEAFTGQSAFYIRKQEREPLFKATTDLTNPYGSTVQTDFFKKRIDAPKLRNNEVPLEQVRVGPGVNRGYGTDGTGGFHQFDVVDVARPKTVDELRVKTNPKQTFEGRIVEGQRGSRPAKMGTFAQHRPSTLYEQTPDHLLKTTGAYLADKQRPHVDAKDTQRRTTSNRTYKGPAFHGASGKNMEGAALVQPSHRHQLGKLGLTNPALTTVGKGTHYDYGKNAVLIYDNNRVITQACPPKPSNVTSLVKSLVAPIEDVMRMTRKETTEHTAREGMFNPQMPSKSTVYDPNQVMRTTIKETTLHDGGYVLIDACRTQGTRTYDPDAEKPRTTGRETMDPLDTALNLGAAEDRGYVRDPEDRLRTTTAETTIHDAREGTQLTAVDRQRGSYTEANFDAPPTHKEVLTQMGGGYLGQHDANTDADGYKVASPEARTTQRELIENQEYFGAADSGVEQRSMSYEDIYNATLNEVREVTLKEREPTQTSTKVASGGDTVNLDVRRQVLENHMNGVNKDRATTIAISSKLGAVTREPQTTRIVHTDDRLDGSLLTAFHENPYTHRFEDVM